MQRSALILAGGKGTRLGTQEKALLSYNGKTFLEKTMSLLYQTVDEVIVSVRDKEQQKTLSEYASDVKFVCDKQQGKGPLTGMLQGMQAASHNYIFVVACDMPFIRSDVIDMLFEEAEGYDGAIPVWSDGRKEPLHAVYSKERVIPAIERSILKYNYRVMSAVSQLCDVKFISMDKIKHIDSDLISFANINTLADLEFINKKVHVYEQTYGYR